MGRNKTCVFNPILEQLLTKPFSEHSDLDHVPFQDMEAYVSRSVELRHKELGLGKVKRPCNNFILYLTATHSRAEAWREVHFDDLPEASLNLSTIISRSWSLEPPSVKAKYQALAEIDKQMHGKAFPDYKFLRKPPRNRRKQVKSVANLSTTDGKQIQTKAAVAPQPLPSYNIQVPFPSSSTQQLHATSQSPPKELSPHIIQRLATLSGRARELETFLKLCQTSELMRDAYYPTDKGLDYQLAIVEYNAFVASISDSLKHYVRKDFLKPYVPRVYDLQWVYDERFGMYKVSVPFTWPSMDLPMPASVSTPMPMPMDTDYQLPLGGCENGFTADIGVAPSIDTDLQLPLVGFENGLATDLDLDPFANISDYEIGKALQEFEAPGVNTTASEPVVNEPAVNEPAVNEPAVNEPAVDESAQVEQVPLPDFTTTEGLNDSDLLLDQQLSELVDQDIDMMDFINFESQMPL